jgi:hypothetical protein
MPLSSYLSVCEWGCAMFCIVFRLLNAIFICFLKKFCNFPCFFTVMCESSPFLFSYFVNQCLHFVRVC